MRKPPRPDRPTTSTERVVLAGMAAYALTGGCYWLVQRSSTDLAVPVLGRRPSPVPSAPAGPYRPWPAVLVRLNPTACDGGQAHSSLWVN